MTAVRFGNIGFTLLDCDLDPSRRAGQLCRVRAIIVAVDASALFLSASMMLSFWFSRTVQLAAIQARTGLPPRNQ